jgi:glycine cleavage system H lipoate-binding protein
MRCPFLQEAAVRFCEVGPFRKLIPISSSQPDTEKCSSPGFARCPWAAGRLEQLPEAASCPFLRKTLVQYCSAAPERRFVPYSDLLLSCCTSDSHRYCDLFLAVAKPERRKGDASHGGAGGAPEDAVEVPPALAFSPNHMWLDLRPDASCHVGMDAFFAKVMGAIEEISFATPGSRGRPTAIARAHGVSLPLVFPGFLPYLHCNVRLRTDPGRIVSDPYGRGWLFEGSVAFDPAGDLRRGLLRGLFSGEHVLAWMKSELERMTHYVHERLSRAAPGQGRLLADGGVFCDGVALHLSPGDLLQLFNEFFSPQRAWSSP